MPQYSQSSCRNGPISTLWKAREVSVSGRPGRFRRHDARMAVAVVERRVGREEIDVAGAFGVPDVDAFGALDDDGSGA